MTGKAYVAIHCWKALSLSNVRRPFLPLFIKGICRNLRLKITAFSKHFPLNMLVFFKKLGSPRPLKWK